MATITGFKQDRVGVYIEKDPYAVLDYSLDWTDWMPSNEVIDTISITAESIAGDANPLTIDSTTNTDYIATAFVSGGTAGKIYNVEYKIVTDQNKQDSRNIRIKVLERQA